MCGKCCIWFLKWKWMYYMIFSRRDFHLMCFTTVAIEVRSIVFCVMTLNSTNHPYSCRGKWLGGESDLRSCHKDNPRVFMTVTTTNIVYQCSRAIFLSPSMHDFTSLTLWHIFKQFELEESNFMYKYVKAIWWNFNMLLSVSVLFIFQLAYLLCIYMI